MYTVISLYCICSTVQKSCSSQFNIYQEDRGGFFSVLQAFWSSFSFSLAAFSLLFTPVCVQGDFQKNFLSHLLLTYESFKHKKDWTQGWTSVRSTHITHLSKKTFFICIIRHFVTSTLSQKNIYSKHISLTSMKYYFCTKLTPKELFVIPACVHAFRSPTLHSVCITFGMVCSMSFKI